VARVTAGKVGIAGDGFPLSADRRRPAFSGWREVSCQLRVYLAESGSVEGAFKLWPARKRTRPRCSSVALVTLRAGVPVLLETLWLALLTAALGMAAAQFASSRSASHPYAAHTCGLRAALGCGQ